MYMWATLTELSGLPKIYFYIQTIYIHVRKYIHIETERHTHRGVK